MKKLKPMIETLEKGLEEIKASRAELTKTHERIVEVRTSLDTAINSGDDSAESRSKILKARDDVMLLESKATRLKRAVNNGAADLIAPARELKAATLEALVVIRDRCVEKTRNALADILRDQGRVDTAIARGQIRSPEESDVRQAIAGLEGFFMPINEFHPETFVIHMVTACRRASETFGIA
jgi:DNA repair exonuclease SbcCD ATPase subunit